MKTLNVIISCTGINSHSLLIPQSGLDVPSTRGQRTVRPRRYQYLQLQNPRNPNPPVILQR